MAHEITANHPTEQQEPPTLQNRMSPSSNVASRVPEGVAFYVQNRMSPSSNVASRVPEGVAFYVQNRMSPSSNVASRVAFYVRELKNRTHKTEHGLLV